MVELTKRQLYDLVWSKPMRDAAATIPMSDVGLKKVCLKNQIPVPPQGYWNKLQAGQPVAKIPMPASALGDQRIWITRLRQKASAEVVLPREQAIEALRAAGPAISPRDAAHWHACTRRTRSALGTAEPDRRGALCVSGPGIPSINVALETIPRALALLDHLIRTAEELGHSVSPNSDPAALVIVGELVKFGIHETFLRTDAPADAAEWARRRSFERKYPKHVQRMSYSDPWMFRPGGKLTITLTDSYAPGLRKVWKDRVSCKVEDQIGEVVAEAVAHGAAMKADRERRERRELEEQEAERQRQQDKAEQAKESSRMGFLKKRADLFEEAETLARFVRHLRHTMPDHRSEKMRRFLEWADARVDRVRKKSTAPAVDDDLAESELW